MPTYAVTGASGRFGRLVVEDLLARGVRGADIVAIARTVAKVSDLGERGVEIRQADYARAETLPAALAGVDRVLLVSGSEPGQRIAQHTAVIEAAKAAGVERILYTSMLRADTTASPLAPEHRATEQALMSSCLAFTLLRNSFYIENYTSQLAQYLQRGEIVGAAGSGRVSGAVRADFAAAAAAALTRDCRGNVVHELGGTPFTFAELAATITDVTGARVVYRDLSPTDLAAALQAAGLDARTAALASATGESIARGELETTSEDLTRLLGRPSTTLAQATRTAYAGLSMTSTSPAAATAQAPAAVSRSSPATAAVGEPS